MAFYKNIQGKTSQERRKAAIERGGFEDEGSRYRTKGGHQGGAKHSESGYRSETKYDARSQSSRYDKPRQGSYHGGHQGSGSHSEGGYRGGENKGRYQQEYRGYRENVSRPVPYGERRINDRKPMSKKSGEYRFSSYEGNAYTHRGQGTQPRPYNEQRRQRSEQNGYDRFRYEAPKNVYAPAPVFAPVVKEAEENPEIENLLCGRNPIREALKSGRDIEKLLIAKGDMTGSAREIVQMAKEKHIPIQEVERVRLDAIARHNQGMVAYASAYQYSTVEAMLALAEERGEEPFLILLDGITDPHNLGAIIRSAECAGAHGVIVQERRAVGLTPAAVKASAGAVEYMPVARVTNLTQTIDMLKEKNIWVYAADMDGEDYTKADLSGAAALVIGAEGEGVSRRVLDNCDKTVSLPIRGKVDSLNASVAAGILMYAVMQTR